MAGRPRLALYSGAHSLRMNEKFCLFDIFYMLIRFSLFNMTFDLLLSTV